MVTVLSLALVTLTGMGFRLLMMFTVQQRRERMKRQINERLRTLIAAYKVLGGSFTGNLAVDPTHLRELRRGANPGEDPAGVDLSTEVTSGSDRTRRIRDAAEAALSDHPSWYGRTGPTGRWCSARTGVRAPCPHARACYVASRLRT